MELVIYFFLITLGIVTNVDPNLSVNFTLFFALVAVLSEIYRIIANKLNFKVNLQKEFDYYLRIELHEENNELDKIENLLHKSFMANNSTYNIGLFTTSEAYEIINKIGNEKIINYSIDKNTDNLIKLLILLFYYQYFLFKI